MIILAIDTCCGVCSVALFKENVLIASKEILKPNQQAENLMSLIDIILKEGGFGFKDLSYIAVTIGPGSFTGIRIGLSAAQGISLVHDIPLIGINTLEAIAAKENIFPNEYHIFAGREQVYCQNFVSFDQMVKFSNLPLLKDKSCFDNNDAKMPHAEGVGMVAYNRIVNDCITNAEPLYIPPA